jgi:hypothetical protein
VSTSVAASSIPVWQKRNPPAVKYEFPPFSSSAAFSRMRTLAPFSRAAIAAQSAALPAPTTTTSYFLFFIGCFPKYSGVFAFLSANFATP